ncbi:glycosyltransferase [Clostridium cibarium]|uniref:Glycosyltransferase family 1 protein n=1 Tax=Clostridium cibarium TaxID=2762247 RepID=A0ABR8PQR2_9CLOT|nr:glycosyltransferase [Clostridium cibarium]MBD7910518.1 glycosyltransferase family 1 protein [Clostridium cibarium]
MSKIIFFAQPTMGHTNAMLSIAVRLKELGHDVSFVVPTVERVPKKVIDRFPEFVKTALSVPEKVKVNEINYISIDMPNKLCFKYMLLPLAKGFTETQYAMNVFSDCLYKYSKLIEDIVLKEKPDVIVNDFFFLPPYIVAEKYTIPCITIYHSGLPFSGDGIPPFGSGLDINGQWGWKGKLYHNLSRNTNKLVTKRYVKACKRMGISDIREVDWSKPYSKWLNLLLTVKEVEAPRELNNSTIFVGPCVSCKRVDLIEKFPFEVLRDDVSKIYVSLGTVFNNKPEVFKKILNGIEKENFQVIVSAGGSYDKLMKCGFGDNILIFKRVPQLEILKKVDLVISHGGNNTINETLAAGKPIVVIPIGGEQGDNASKIEYLKVAKKINISNFSSNEVLEKVKSILDNPIYKENADRIREIISKTDGVNTSVELINWVAENGKTILI